MTRTVTFIVGLFLWTATAFGQEPVDVTDQTIKIGGLKEEELHFGFAAGDKIVFSFKEADNKELKEIEIVEYPNNSKFSDYKTKQVDNKTISVTKQGVYIFRFKNSALGGRICKIKIQRIPASEETKNFNSTVTWVNKQETTYNTYTKDVIVGYDTTYVQKTKKELVKTELSEDMIMNKTERVHSINNLDYKNYKTVQVTLPQNEISTYKTKKIVSWAYWIGVGKEATDAWTKNVNTVKNVASGAATILGGGPLAGLAIGAVSSLAMPTMGEDVAYWFITDYNNAQLFMASQTFMQFDKGKGIAAYGKNSNRTQGVFYIGLSNDNQFQGIDANVKISVIWETNYYEDKQYTEMKVTPRYEKKTFSDPVIKTIRVPETGQ
jgi:GH24 family phage-related lysozyme (muramidase)